MIFYDLAPQNSHLFGNTFQKFKQLRYIKILPKLIVFIIFNTIGLYFLSKLIPLFNTYSIAAIALMVDIMLITLLIDDFKRTK